MRHMSVVGIDSNQLWCPTYDQDDAQLSTYIPSPTLQRTFPSRGTSTRGQNLDHIGILLQTAL